MRLGITVAAVASTLVLAAASAATATPLVNLKTGAPGVIDLVRSGGGHGGGHGGAHMGGPRGGSMTVHRGAMGSIGRQGAMAGKAFKGGGRSVYRGGGGKFAYKGGGKYRGGSQAWRGKGYRGAYAWNGYRGHGRHHRHNYPYFWPGVAWGGVGIYSTYGYGGCGWVYRRAMATGSPYWWRRYQDCIYGY
jgi:hypothetical protein